MTSDPVFSSGLYFDLRVDYSTREITVSGEFDVATAPCLARAVAGFQRSAPGDITIRLGEVTFMDMAGVGALVGANSAQRDRGDGLALTGATEHVRRLFTLSRLTDMLQPPDPHPTTRAANRMPRSSRPYAVTTTPDAVGRHRP